MVSLRWRLGSPVWGFLFLLSIARFSFTKERLVLPRNWEIGFVSSSFSFRACRAVHAGKAKLRGRMSSDVLIAGPPRCECPGVRCSFSHIFCFYSHAFKEFVVLLFAFCLFFVVIYRFSGSVFLFDSTVLDEHELQKHFVK